MRNILIPRQRKAKGPDDVKEEDIMDVLVFILLHKHHGTETKKQKTRVRKGREYQGFIIFLTVLW